MIRISTSRFRSRRSLRVSLSPPSSFCTCPCPSSRPRLGSGTPGSLPAWLGALSGLPPSGFPTSDEPTPSSSSPPPPSLMFWSWRLRLRLFPRRRRRGASSDETDWERERDLYWRFREADGSRCAWGERLRDDSTSDMVSCWCK